MCVRCSQSQLVYMLEAMEELRKDKTSLEVWLLRQMKKVHDDFQVIGEGHLRSVRDHFASDQDRSGMR